MKRLHHLLVISLLFFTAAAAQTTFNKPWKNPARAFVLDGKHDNDIDWEKLKADQRVAGMIFRATGPVENTTTGQWEFKPDPKYEALKAEAKSRGYLWGSFHVGVSEIDAEEQAKRYLEFAKPTDDEVIALDLEDINKPQYMKLDEAVRFIRYIKNATGRYPMVYVPDNIFQTILKRYGSDKEHVFGRTPLWYVRTLSSIEKFFPKDHWWNSYTLWQFSSELNCCRKVAGKRVCDLPRGCPFREIKRVPGVAFDMDINVFDGSVAELRSKWPFTHRDK